MWQLFGAIPRDADISIDSRDDINRFYTSPNLDAVETQLHAAVRRGQVSRVVLYIAMGADVEAEGRFVHLEHGTRKVFLNLTPIHLAALTKDTSALQLLLDSGANVTATWRSAAGERTTHISWPETGTALDLVLLRLQEAGLGVQQVKERHFKTIDMLLDHGLDVNAPKLMEMAMETFSAPLVKHLMGRGGKVPGGNLGHFCRAAVRKRSITALEFGVEELGYRDLDHGLGGLKWAADYRSYDEPLGRMWSYLFSRLQHDLGPGKSINGVPGRYAVFLRAARYGNASAIQDLLNHGFDVNRVLKPMDWTLLVAVCKMHPTYKVVRLLLDAGASAVDTADSVGTSPLSALSTTPRFTMSGRTIDSRWHAASVVKLLLEAGADPNHRTVNPDHSKDYTPLSRAVLRKQYHGGLLEALVDGGADIERKSTPCERCKMFTPLMIAAATDRGTMPVGALLKAGANIEARSGADCNGTTALIAACGRCGPWSAPVVRLLLDAGADVNHCGGPACYGITALHAACGGFELMGPSHDIVELLLKAGAHVDHGAAWPAGPGVTPLLMACTGPHIPGRTSRTLRLLLNAGADVNCRWEASPVERIVAGSTALHCIPPDLPEALECVKILLAAGADPAARNARGETPLHTHLGWLAGVRRPANFDFLVSSECVLVLAQATTDRGALRAADGPDRSVLQLLETELERLQILHIGFAPQKWYYRDDGSLAHHHLAEAARILSRD
ncbi:hypothetical protein GGTG_12810 [Gaeumannomyces tritici R3-111a-1]|uniref:Uncharacterized protein n=1 Tax=Gaeumannomyces tritici (strain R3-111a-1) TaxID=644352 RepID=J3PH30_GAET3|nr:hypothetical protein GGTG_12810 [Gaeumannomyces tritici R3-111a-1]EJT69927.1 hypothetical protein GGTG_12810 [Gaeumannomyces tritici R3-111a-1]